MTLTLFQFLDTFKRDPEVVVVLPSRRVVEQLDVSDVYDRL